MEEYRFKSKMEGNKLIVKGKTYTTKNMHTLPSGLSTYEVSSRTSDNSIGFFGELSPYSNFHPSPFLLDGIYFHSAEQYIQYQKAMLFSDMKIASDILSTTDALTCKKLSIQIEGYTSDLWNTKAKHICERGIMAKFQQNHKLQCQLLSTGNKKLVECSYDKKWGCGIPLSNATCLDESGWSEENLLGTILMESRAQLRSIISDNTEQPMVS